MNADPKHPLAGLWEDGAHGAGMIVHFKKVLGGPIRSATRKPAVGVFGHNRTNKSYG